jgi:regulator of sirC expression with transglutaminase-like and TPR domain
MDATARFVELVGGPEAELPLDEACLLVAAHAHPGMAVDEHLDRLDRLALAVPDASVDGVVDLLFRKEGFRGNVEHYYEPENSFLDSVLERRLGIPITLSILTMEIGRRVGVPLDGIGMPGHFLIRERDHPQVFVDPFHAGRRLDVAGCAELFHRFQGTEATFGAELLDAVGPRAILARLLANLRATYHQRGDRRALVWTLRLRSRIPGVPLGEWRALASALTAIGRFDEAADELEGLAGHVDEPSATKLANRARELRARLN